MFRVGQSIIRQTTGLHKKELNRLFATSTKAATVDVAPTKSKDEVVTNKSFIANIFRGEIQPAEVFPYPVALDNDGIEFVGSLIDPVTKFFTEVNNPAKNDENSKIDDVTLAALWELGAFGLQVPQDYGGIGLNNTQYARLTEIVGAHDLGLGICMGAHQSIGFKGILLYGTKEQKEKYLPQVSTGKVYAAFCLTEPSAGSDAGSIKCRAVKSADGKHFVLNGSKIWISNGGIADIMTVFAQTEMDDPKTGKKKDKMTAFIVERGFGGVTSGPPENKMGIKCSNTTEIYYEDCKVPVENMLGEQGQGFKVAMNILNNGRFGMASTMSGTMTHCIQKATEHATNRFQFGKKIQEYGAIQEKIARMSMLQYATQSMAYMISGNMDTGSVDYHLEAAISKVFASECAWFTCDEAIQVLGGMGFMKDAGLERVLRDLRIFRIFEGSNDILRLFVALTAIQYAGVHLKGVQKAFKNPAANFGVVLKESSKRALRPFGYGGVDMSSYVAPALVESSKLCSESIDIFAQAVETLLIKYGKNIIDEQFLLKNLADSVIDIYAMAVTLSRATRSIEKNLPTAAHEKLLTETWCVEAAERVRLNIRRINAPEFTANYKRMANISKAVCEKHDVIQSTPLGV